MITRKESMVIDITTAGVADESPLCWRRHEYARQIREGCSRTGASTGACGRLTKAC